LLKLSAIPFAWLSGVGITQLKAQGPSRTCNESKEEEEEGWRFGLSIWFGVSGLGFGLGVWACDLVWGEVWGEMLGRMRVSFSWFLIHSAFSFAWCRDYGFEGLRFRGLRVSGSGSRVPGSRFQVPGFGF